jgi:hypothetical protein
VEALSLETIRPTLIIFRLVRVSVPINLNDQLGLRAEKIGNVGTKPDLTPELVTIELSGPQTLPEPAFGWRRMFSSKTDSIEAIV